eukprot:1072668-Pyramimonas_sp.AAC.1
MQLGSLPLHSYWERIFSKVTEITPDCPTHYCSDTATAATLDKSCIGIPSHHLPDAWVFAEVGVDAATISGSRLSDHAPISLSLRDRVRRDQQTSSPQQ